MGRQGGAEGVLALAMVTLLFGVMQGFEISMQVEEEVEQIDQPTSTFESFLELPREAAPAPKKAFDYFVFAQQWPGTYCKQKGTCCQNVEKPVNFTVHGLWPEFEDGSWPECCSGPGFDQDKIDELTDLLQEYWPTMSCTSPKQCSGKKTGSFWQHEWEKHGTCAYPIIPDEATYFTVGLNLRLQYDISKILKDAGFIPSNKKYTTSKVVAAVKAGVGGHSPIFTCKSGGISEIWICFTKDLKIRNCGSSSNSCPKTISIPPFKG